MIRIAVNGAGGRMSKSILQAAHGDGRFEVAAALQHPDSPLIGTDVAEVTPMGPHGLVISTIPHYDVDVYIDFAKPPATLTAIDFCIEQDIPLVIGTTGHTPDQLARIEDAADDIPILKATNMSVGINVLQRVVREVAVALGHEYDAEIVETHHRFKADAPSGTALSLLETILGATGRNIDDHAIFGRHGDTGSRPGGQVGVHAVRRGNVFGEHEIHFSSLGETVTLRHTAHSRDIFAQGALRAAEWLMERRPGLYSMQDVLFGEG